MLTKFPRLALGLNPILFLSFLTLLFLSISRIALSAWYLTDNQSHYWPDILLIGLRVDLIIICLVWGIPALLLTLCSFIPSKRLLSLLFILLRPYCAFFGSLLVFNELATWGFMREFGTRPSSVYVEYLQYPVEVFSSAWEVDSLSCIVCIASFLLVAGLIWSFIAACAKNYKPLSWKLNSVVFLILLVLLPAGVRSSFAFHGKAFHPTLEQISTSYLVNSLFLNSTYSSAYAIAHMKTMAKRLDKNEVVQRYKEMTTLFTPETENAKCPFNQRILPFAGIYDGSQGLQEQNNSTVDHKPYNIVIVLAESLGDNQVKSLGGKNLTPNLDRLAQEGWWFENAYATGFYSVRGLEGVVASYPATQLEAIERGKQSAHDLTTVLEIASQAGYKTSFIYPGNSEFDNMNIFLSHNGADQIIDKKTAFKNPKHPGIWGEADEEYFEKVHELLNEFHEQNEPFCTVLFTVSNHAPYNCPAGKVSLPENTHFANALEKDITLGALYADYALGKFIDQAKKENTYYKDTIFLIIGDHEVHMKRGNDGFPMKDTGVAALILAPNVAPHADPRTVSQIDMGLTILSLAGIEGEAPNVGQNLLRSDIKEHASMIFMKDFAYLHNDRLIVLDSVGRAQGYKVDAQEKLHPLDKLDPQEIRDAEVQSNLAYWMMKDDAIHKSCISVKKVAK